MAKKPGEIDKLMPTGTTTESTTKIAKVGQPAPDFNMPSTKNMLTLHENVKLSDYKGKWLIILFYYRKQSPSPIQESKKRKKNHLPTLFQKNQI